MPFLKNLKIATVQIGSCGKLVVIFEEIKPKINSESRLDLRNIRFESQTLKISKFHRPKFHQRF